MNFPSKSSLKLTDLTRMQLRGLHIKLLWAFIRAFLRLKSILFEDRMCMTRLLIAGSSLTWAVMLEGPNPLFTDKRTTYLVMRVFFTEDQWALLFFVSGVMGMYSLLFDVRNKATLLLDGVLGALLWTTSTTACFAAHWPMHITTGWLDQLLAYPPPAAMSGEFWLSVAAWWHCIRFLTDRNYCCSSCAKNLPCESTQETKVSKEQ